jgi:hypothetical protein
MAIHQARTAAWLLTGALLAVLPAYDAAATPGRGICSSCHSGAPILTSTPANGSTLSFGNVLVGESAANSLTVTNTGHSRSGLIGTFPPASGEFVPQSSTAFTTEYSGQLIRNRTGRTRTRQRRAAPTRWLWCSRATAATPPSRSAPWASPLWR